PGDEPKANTAFIDGVRQYVTDVKELEIDLIDRINPFQTARAILAKSMDEGTLKEVAAIIAKKRINLSHEEARMLAERAVRFRQETG
ncbi:DEAD/DEAH box helicase, partial [Staphylococcus pasteuri_A]|nr:DEAD/DEAH box helicase [Staphylococcus pasteuri_A]